MRHSPLAPFALAALLSATLPAALAAQDDHPSKGKIDDVERSADNAKDHDRHNGRDRGEHEHSGGGFFMFWRVLVYVPTDTGQGYLDHPYAVRDVPETFVLRDVDHDRAFGAFSATYFRDAGSTLRGGNFTLEWAGGVLDRELDYTFYREPKANETDYLHLIYFGVSGLPPVGDAGFFRIGLGMQAIVLDNGDAAAGPTLELGTQLFPGRPFGLGGTLRLAPLTWRGGPLFGTGFVDVAGHGSMFVGPVELMLGYRWTRVGLGAPFSGPTLGMRLWF